MNEANWERIARAGVGVILLILSATALSGVLALAAVVVGGILTLTGAIGWCPIHAVLGSGTRKAA